MKKLVLFVFVVSLALTAGAQNFVECFRQKYGEREDFTVVNISQKMLQMVALAADEKDQALLKNLTGLKVITTEKQPEVYYTDAIKMLTEKEGNMEELMSVKEKEEDVRMFTREEKGIVSELVIIVKEKANFVLIGITGDIDLQQMAGLSKSLQVNGLEQLEKIQKKQ